MNKLFNKILVNAALQIANDGLKAAKDVLDIDHARCGDELMAIENAIKQVDTALFTINNLENMELKTVEEGNNHVEG